jgi:hypothetical protein
MLDIKEFPWGDFEKVAEISETIAHFSVIGLVASEWASFEMALDAATIKLSKLDRNFALCLTSQVIGSGRKVDALISVAKLLGASQIGDDLEKFAKETQTLAERRNRAIHDPWIITNAAHRRFEISARRKLKFESKEVGTEELIELVEHIINHHRKLSHLAKSIAERAASSQKHT